MAGTLNVKEPNLAWLWNNGVNDNTSTSYYFLLNE